MRSHNPAGRTSSARAIALAGLIATIALPSAAAGAAPTRQLDRAVVAAHHPSCHVARHHSCRRPHRHPAPPIKACGAVPGMPPCAPQPQPVLPSPPMPPNQGGFPIPLGGTEPCKC